MMEEHVYDLLSAYIDDELSLDEKDAVEQHLQECSTCQLELNDLRDIQSQLFLSYQYMEPSGSLVNNISRRIAAEQREKAFTKGIFLVAIIGFIVSSVLFVQFLSVIQTIGHLFLVFFNIGQSVIRSLFTLLAGNAYVSGGVIIAAVIIIITMIPVLKYLISSTSIEARRSAS